MLNRKAFLKTLGLSGAGLLLTPADSFGAIIQKEVVKLTILHTNDTHSRIDPFPSNDPKYPSKGGVERRASLIDSIRNKEDNVLLLDAGDIFQGTPYFNMYGGEIEFKVMSKMGYDATTIGNHDFDNGLEGLKKMLPHASFPFLNSNYDLSNTILKDSVLDHKIFNKQGLRIGVFGIGVEMAGLVSRKNYGDAIYLDPIKIANKKAKELKLELGCHLVICLSHLGHHYDTNKVSDIVLAKASENIDLIIGGHTHTFLTQPDEIKNNKGKKILVNQVGWAGICLGRIDYTVHLKTKKNASKGVSLSLFNNEVTNS